MRLRNTICSAAAFAAAACAQELTLENAVQKAVLRVKERELLRIAAARGAEQYLEGQGRFKIELQPSLGLLAFSNPAVAATRLGAGLLLGRRDAPSPWLRQDARLNTLAAEIAAEQAIVRTEMDTVQRFFDVLDRRRSMEELRNAVDRRLPAVKAVEERVRERRATAADRASWQVSLTDLEIQLTEAEAEHDAARLRLAELVAAHGELDTIAFSRTAVLQPVSIPAAEELYRLAFERRRDVQAVRRRLDQEKRNVPRDRRVRVNGISTGYAHLSDSAGTRLGLGGGTLLGGNTGAADLGVTVALRDTGSRAAMAAAFDARIRGLELELESIESSIRLQVDWLRALVVNSSRRAELAARKAHLTEEIWKTAVAREQTGLTTPEAVLSAELELFRARSAARQFESERQARWHHLASACGLGVESRPPEQLLAELTIPR